MPQNAEGDPGGQHEEDFYHGPVPGLRPSSTRAELQGLLAAMLPQHPENVVADNRAAVAAAARMTKGHLGLKTTSKELSTKEDEVEAAIVKKPRGWSSWASTIEMDIHLELFLKSSLPLFPSERMLVMVSAMIPIISNL